MPISRIVLPTRGWFVPSLFSFVPLALLVASIACSPSEQPSTGRQDAAGQESVISKDSSLRDSLAVICPNTGRRGSVQVARVDPKVEEGGVAFKLLGDGAGPGVVLCRDVLYADVAALIALMGDTVKVSEGKGRAILDGAPTDVRAYSHEGILHVAVGPYARHRRAVVLVRSETPMDAVVWPQEALKHLKASGLTQGRAYQAAVREGLVPK